MQICYYNGRLKTEYGQDDECHDIVSLDVNQDSAKSLCFSHLSQVTKRQKIIATFDITTSVLHLVLWIWNRFLETGSAGRRPGQGRRRATTPNEDRYLVLTARRHRNMNATLLQQHLRSATGTTVSTQTVRNRIHGVGLYARRPLVCVRLTSRRRRDRKEWATEHVNWRRNEWSNVLFYNESRFSVHPNNRRIFIWRDRGKGNLCRRVDVYDLLLKRQENYPFSKHIFPEDEKWVVYKNVKHKMSWNKKDEPAQSTWKADIHEKSSDIRLQSGVVLAQSANMTKRKKPLLEKIDLSWTAHCCKTQLTLVSCYSCHSTLRSLVEPEFDWSNFS
ncbi:transposable element Tcb2 transposase [Trichonephila clavipes]|nr:transposable element Tcb2 transposase [Trichonephila clavipes]